MNIKDLSGELERLMGEILDDSSLIIAHTAAEYYRDRFSHKAFDGQAWPQGRPKRRGSLLVQSGALANSIHPSVITRERVVISAGGDKIPYAQAHNEGVFTTVHVPAHIRQGKNGLRHPVRMHQRNMRLPRRQYMGQSGELNKIIYERLQGYVNDKLNQ